MTINRRGFCFDLRALSEKQARVTSGQSVTFFNTLFDRPVHSSLSPLRVCLCQKQNCKLFSCYRPVSYLFCYVVFHVSIVLLVLCLY